MMKTFNSTFETILRILRLMSQADCEMNTERIMLIDFIATYGKTYHVANVNLHGDDSTGTAELAARRIRVRRALNQMLQYGYIIPKKDNVFQYKISEEGRVYASLLHSDYANIYSSAVEIGFRLYGGYSDTELMELICERYGGDSL